jgi:Outer membrane protein beta-barrel domain
MKHLFFLLVFAVPLFLFGQNDSKEKEKKGLGFGIKAGMNFSNVSNASEINTTNNGGFHGGLILGAGSGKIFGYRTELLYSKQGYNYGDGTTNGEVNLDYILFPQLTTISLTRFLQIQAGMHLAYLINVKADKESGNSDPLTDIMDLYNRFDYGISLGLETNPIVGLLIGARYTKSLSDLYKSDYMYGGTLPPFIPSLDDIDLKNNLIQIYVGYKF